MKKRILRVLIVIVMVVGLFLGVSITAQAADSVGDWFSYDNIFYKITAIGDSPTVSIINLNSHANDAYTGEHLTIPEKVPHNGVEYTVAAIGADAFNSHKTITTINLPNTITALGMTSFAGTKLTSFSVPPLVETIPEWIFSGCNNLRTVTITREDKVVALEATNAFNGIANNVTILVPVGMEDDYKADPSWKSMASRITDGVHLITFDGGGAQGEMQTANVPVGQPYTLPESSFTAPSGYQFKGWATSVDGPVISGTTITVSGDTTLYAVWEKILAETPVINAVSDDLNLTYGDYENQTISVDVEEKDGYTYKYEWVRENTVVSTTTTDTYTIPNDLEVDNHPYGCIVWATRNDNGETAAKVSETIWVKVNRKSLDGTNVALSDAAFTYNGTEQKPSVTVTCNGKTLNEDTDYNITWPIDCKNADDKTVTVTFKGNYSGQAAKTFEIKAAPLTVTANNKTITYGDAPANDGVTYDDFVNGETASVLNGTLGYDYSYTQYDNAGDYDITPKGLTSQNYEITFVNGTLSVEQKEIGIAWSDTALTYNGAPQKPVATAAGTVNGDELALTVGGEQTNASDTAYTATVTGISGEKARNYKLPSSVTADFTIAKADQTAPAVNKENETISKKADGKLTDVSADMQYRAEGESTYTDITGNTVENLAAGKYYVRLKGDSNHNPSPDTAVTIAAGRKLTVTLPQNQVGYTMTTSTPEVDWFGSIRVEFELLDGYSLNSDFRFYNGTEPIDFALIGDVYVLGLNFVTDDFDFTVTGVADNTEPDAEITIKDNKWTSFWNDLTFDLFFKETQDVTITATDKGSGVNTVQYYLASEELERNAVIQITDWEDYTDTFQIDPDNEYVIYAKVTDNAGNVLYLNSDGVILDKTPPVLVGISNGEVYYGDKVFKALDDYLKVLKVDGIDVTAEMNGDNEYKIIADNAKHTIAVTDKAGNVTEYTITVYKIYTITFMDEDGVYKTLTYKHGEAVTMPEVPTKDGYTVTWETTIEKATGNATVNAVYTQNAVSDSPQTGDTSHIALWIALLFISGTGVFGITLYDRKRKATTKR